MGTGAYAASAGGCSASLSSSSSSRSCVCGSRVASRGILPVERAHLLGWASFFSARLTPHRSETLHATVTSAPRRTSLQRHIAVLTSFSSSPRVMASHASLPQSHAAAHLLGWASFLSSRLKPHRSETLHATVMSSRRSRICAASSRLALVPAKLKPHRTESAVPA